jgi:type IV pilus assembly protein PilW
VYQVFNVSENFKRNTTGVADAQQNGLLSSFLMSLDLSSANNGIASAGLTLDACPDTGDIATTLRPIPVLIEPGADDMTPDAFVVNYGVTSRLVIPANFNSEVITGVDPAQPYEIQSPAGFMVGDQIALIEPNDISGAGRCGRTKVTAIAPTDTPSIVANNGYVTLTHDTFAGPAAGCLLPAPPGTYCGDSVVLNLGPSQRRMRYDITDETLRASDLLIGGGAQPVASNVVNMKLQYGIDTNNDGMADKWVKAVNGADGDFSKAGVMAMPYVDLSRIKAVRIAVIVRSEQFDSTQGDWAPAKDIFGECGEWTCPAAPTISYAASVSPPGNFRYRSYETIVPLRNAIWNIQKK